MRRDDEDDARPGAPTDVEELVRREQAAMLRLAVLLLCSRAGPRF